jgi:hypothetical protein
MRDFGIWIALGLFALTAAGEERKYLDPIDVKVPPLAGDPAVKIDYDIVYVRAPRAGDEVHKRFYADFSAPVTMEPGADLMLLHPDGTEEVLAKGGDGAITDPVVSFDAQWVYFVHLHDMRKADSSNPPAAGSDIYKIHLKTRKMVRLTNQRFTPNEGAARWSRDYRSQRPGFSHFEYGVYNMGPCPLPGGRIAFTSNRDGFRPAKGYPAICLQLFVMDDRDTDLPWDDTPANLEKIGHLNLAGALHPVVLRDGRIMYSTLESQGARTDILWGIWTIHPDGTNWNPLVSAFDPGGAPNGFHFQTQLGNGEIVVEEYYNQNNSGFGSLVKLPRPGSNPLKPSKDPNSDLSPAAEAYPEFGPANMDDPRNKPWRYGRHDNGKPRDYRIPFMPLGSVSLTPFSHGLEGPADHSILGDKASAAVGKFTHPSGAPDNHLLVCYSPGPANHQYTYLPQIDGGIYLIKGGEVVNQPSEMRRIKNDPNYNECWPRAVVPYKRIYGLDEPLRKERLRNDGKLSPHLPEGTPFALVGTSSFYKRETYPNGSVPEGYVTATYTGKDDPWKGLDPFTTHGNGMPLNWSNQGADAGLYTNDQIHAVRIIAMEPTTDRKGADAGRRYHNHAGERLRVLGEIPLRKFVDGKQPLDPDGNPDTSFLAKIPADVGFTFQTLDKRGMVLNAAQTWHHLRPGEIRHNCGGCHAHSQKPTEFKDTFAARPDAKVWDLTAGAPILAEKAKDESKAKWDADDSTGLRFAKGPVNVEYWRDVMPILQRSCVECHTARGGKQPSAGLNLDADEEAVKHENEFYPGTYFRLALDQEARFGPKPPGWDGWGATNASRYVRKFQSRRSLLVWKIHGERLDGFSNDDHPSEEIPGSGRLFHKGRELELARHKAHFDLDYAGSPMPKEGAKASKPLTDEDKRTIARWIDLGCPIDLDYNPFQPERTGFGWMLDDQRPTLALTEPRPGTNAELHRILIGVYDYGKLDFTGFKVSADFEIDGQLPGTRLSNKFRKVAEGVWEYRFEKPIRELGRGTVIVSIADQQGNITRVERMFKVGK